MFDTAPRSSSLLWLCETPLTLSVCLSEAHSSSLSLSLKEEFLILYPVLDSFCLSSLAGR